VALRVPELYNAAAFFNSDEAVNALFIRHLVAGRELALHPWGVTYYGIVEGLLALPFVAVLGFTPLAFKLSAVVGLVLLQLAVYRLGSRLYGPNEGIGAALLLAAFSPQVVNWSTLAVGGKLLVVAWGTLTLCRLHTLWREPSPWRAASLGFMVGFGVYIYELYVVYVVALAIWGLGVFVAARGRWPLRLVASFVAGLALGLVPRAVPLWQGRVGGKAPMYELAGGEIVLDNLRLFFHECVPALFGVHTGGHKHLLQEVGFAWPAAGLVGALVIAFYAAVWLWRARAALRWPPPGVESLLVLLVPVTALAFIASPNPRAALSVYYLFPWLSSLPLFAGAALVVIARRSRPAVVALAMLLVALPALQIVAWYRHERVLDAHLWPRRLRVPLAEAVSYLDRQGFRGAYGWYWIAYKGTFLSGERLIVAPLADWDRYPPYTRFVGRLPRVAYLFEFVGGQRPIEIEQSRRRLADFHNRLESAGASWVEARFGSFLVLHGRNGERLLPADIPGTPVPLRVPRAEVAVGAMPLRAGAGEWLRIPARFTNRSDSFWSATGIPAAAGTLRVAASYRWFDPSGRAVVADGERSLLPGDVRPGEVLPMTLRVRTPERPGVYDLAITLVQENVAWFDQATGSASPRRRVEVVGSRPGRAGFNRLS
jgi:hypothetical protein